MQSALPSTVMPNLNFENLNKCNTTDDFFKGLYNKGEKQEFIPKGKCTTLETRWTGRHLPGIAGGREWGWGIQHSQPLPPQKKKISSGYATACRHYV